MLQSSAIIKKNKNSTYKSLWDSLNKLLGKFIEIELTGQRVWMFNLPNDALEIYPYC